MVAMHPEFLVDKNNERKAVVLPFAEWQQILDELEELEDIRAFDEAKAQG
jgi:PHD/YefM family antitoxin component YafN of YafNO toxin-antitoxin module